MSLTNTPSANRMHIAIFGKRNSGKSSLINAITGHTIALVSDVAGTTTDPVYKAMEIHGIGPCMLIDTAGFDDVGTLGELRVEKTKQAIDKTDVAIVLFGDCYTQHEQKWIDELNRRKIPVIAVVNKADILENIGDIVQNIKDQFSLEPIVTSALSRRGIKQLIDQLIRILPEEFEVQSITAHLVRKQDVVLLVMPQDIQAPKGRLILPQVQTIRDLLDNQCVVVSTTTENLELALGALTQPPKLIIADSQVFKTVYEKKPEQTKLTSFSVLFAAYKGDLDEFVRGASAIEQLTDHSRILIAEACTHAPLSEDIGREKIPAILRKRVGEGLQINIVSGSDFPDDLTPYDLIIHCGGCMFNRKHVLSRVERAKEQHVPITNYGVAIAYLTGILDKISL